MEKLTGLDFGENGENREIKEVKRYN